MRLRLWPSSLRARLTLWYAVFISLPLIVVSVASYFVFAAALQRRTDEFIGDALTAFSRELVAERRAALSASQAMRTAVDEVRFHDLQIAILDAAGHTMASSPALAPSSEGGAHRVVSRPLTLESERFTLTGTYSLRDTEIMLARLRRMFFIAIPLLVLGAAAGGYFLNDLLGRLERAFAQQRRFVADASHELRTPAAILRTEADVTLSRPHRDEAEYRASMTIVQDAARRLARIVDDLFLLARADSGHLVTHPEPVYLEELVHDATRAVRSVADQRAVRVELRGLVEAPFHGDADLLGRLVLNLLDNAIKYSPEGGAVDVVMARHENRYEIMVVDGGPGIPPDVRERIFERFFRVDAARSRSENSATSGAGLGLAIARRIAEMHAGRLELIESRPGRTEFRLTLPA